MKEQWIVVANRTRAFVLRMRRMNELPELVEVLDHDAGRLQDKELVTDRQGRVRQSAGEQSATSQPQETPSEHEAHVFAREIARRLRALLPEQTEAIAFAEPKFLGMLNKAGAPLGRTISKDIVQQAEREMLAAVQRALQPGGSTQPLI